MFISPRMLLRRSHWSVSVCMSDTNKSDIGLTDIVPAVSTGPEFTRFQYQHSPQQL